MARRTRIVATVGPATDSEDAIKQLIKAGVSVFRLNCSHGDWETKRQVIDHIRKHSPRLSPPAILADLQGPKHRLETLPGDGKREVKAGEVFSMGPKAEDLPLTEEDVLNGLAEGDRVLVGDGDVSLRVVEADGHEFQVKVLTAGTIKSKQGVTIAGKSFDSAALTDKDKYDVFEAAQSGVEFIALSYVRSASDMLELRRIVDDYDPRIRLVAKIETKEALKEIDAIIQSSNAVMVARGDLGLQMPLEDVPLAQKRIISRANYYACPVITATQMLESMMVNARPTRAEATDVANAILDGTDAIMLSGETAAGKYPIEAVKMMAKIADKTEPQRLHELHKALPRDNKGDCTEAVAHASVEIAHTLRAKAIVTTSTSGTTPRLVRKFQPDVPVLCATWDEKVFHQLSMIYGVEAGLIEIPETTDQAAALAIEVFVKLGRLKIGDEVVLTAGVPPGLAGNTNLILVRTV